MALRPTDRLQSSMILAMTEAAAQITPHDLEWSEPELPYDPFTRD